MAKRHGVTRRHKTNRISLRNPRTPTRQTNVQLGYANFSSLLISYVTRYGSDDFAYLSSGRCRLCCAEVVCTVRMVPFAGSRGPYTRPTQRLSGPPPIYKLGAENRAVTYHLVLLMMGVCTRNMSS